MKVHLSNIIIYNRAPFDRLNLSFEENEVSVLTGINGQGKTTIMSYIVDSWYELIRNTFSNEFKGREGSYYRISTSLFVPDISKPSIVYIRYKVDNTNVDYINIETFLTQDQYNEIIHLPGKIPFDKIKGMDGRSRKGKIVSDFAKIDLINELFNENVITSFPSFRYELPYYINANFKERFEFRKENFYSGSLKNPLEVISGMDGIANWLMDLVLDKELYDKSQLKGQETTLWINVVNILSATLHYKLKGINVRFAIGRRNRGASRISVVRQDNSLVVYPSIFGMSSGELAILTMFVELLRQADNLNANIQLANIKGIVLIDEIDKHLHIKLQKEVLPTLLQMFPNVQFILSTHSPFLTMGLAEDTNAKERTTIIDLDQGGLSTDPVSLDIYKEVYDIMIGENNNFKQLYDDLIIHVKESTKPLVITEGKTDSKHIINAISKLGVTDIDLDFYEIGSQKWGNTELKKILDSLAKLNNNRKIIGIFDRDVDDFVKYANSDTSTYKTLRPGSNVYVFCIPLVNESEYGTHISIEHYYHKQDLLKVNADGRRLFLGEEFFKNMNSKDGKYQTRTDRLPHKIEVNGVIDDSVYNYTDFEQKVSVAMSKNDFADLVCGNTDFASDFDFSNFNIIIGVLRDIIKQ